MDDHPFFAYFLNAAGTPEKLVVISSTPVDNTDELFTETQLEYFTAQKVIVTTSSDNPIYKEDSVETVMHKVMSVSENVLEEVYLFTESEVHLPTIWRNLFETLAADNNVVGNDVAAQYILAYGLSPPRKTDSYSVADWMSLLPKDEALATTVHVPLTAHPVPLANPFLVAATNASLLSRPLSNEAFLECTTTSTNIYVCRKKQVLQYFRKHQLNDATTAMYFPKRPRYRHMAFSGWKQRDEIHRHVAKSSVDVHRQMKNLVCTFRLPHQSPLSIEHVFERFHANADIPRVTWIRSTGLDPLVRVYKPVAKAWLDSPFFATRKTPALAFHAHSMTLVLDAQYRLTCHVALADDTRFPPSFFRQLNEILRLDKIPVAQSFDEFHTLLTKCSFDYTLALPSTHEFSSKTINDVLQAAPDFPFTSTQRSATFHHISRLEYVPILDKYFDAMVPTEVAAKKNRFWSPPTSAILAPPPPPTSSPSLPTATFGLRLGGGGSFHIWESLSLYKDVPSAMAALLGVKAVVTGEPPGSFLGAIGFYVHKSETEFREMLQESLTLDRFLKYHNGNLPALFRSNHDDDEANNDLDDMESSSSFAKSINMRDPHQVELWKSTVASFRAFRKYIHDTADIDYTYIWDMISDANPELLPDGINLILVQMEHERAQLICPTNAYSSLAHMDAQKPIAIIWKTDKNLYVPLLTENKTPFFTADIGLAAKCRPHASLAVDVYPFRSRLTAMEMKKIIESLGRYTLVEQIGSPKIMGFHIKSLDTRQQSMFIPCLPSARIDDIPQSSRPPVLLPFDVTRTRLEGLAYASKGRIPCKPRYMVVTKEGMRTGLITEANEFVSTVQSVKDPEDDLEEVPAPTPPMPSDKDNDEDEAATTAIRLESQFYHLYQIVVKMHLNEGIKAAWIQQLQSVTITYENKMKYFEDQIRDLVRPHIHFQLVDLATVKDIADLMVCSSSNKPDESVCLTLDDGSVQTIFPKLNLVDGTVNNEKMYPVHLADELIRVRRLQSRMLYDNAASDDKEVWTKMVRDDEIVAPLSTLRSSLTTNRTTVFDTATPQLSAVDIMDATELMRECVVGEKRLTGVWLAVFPSKSKVVVFRNECALAPLMWVLRESPLTAASVRAIMSKAYTERQHDETLVEILGQDELRARVDNNREYALQDIDWWVFCQTMRLPAYLFWSPRRGGKNTWLRLYAEKAETTAYYFIQKRRDGYGILTQTLSMSALNTSDLRDEQGRLVIHEVTQSNDAAPF